MRSWSAKYLDGRTARVALVRVMPTASGLLIERDGGSQSAWSYGELRLTQGFHAGEQIRLERGEGPTPEALLVDDPDFLTEARSMGGDATVRWHEPRRRKANARNAFLAAPGIVLAGLALYFWILPAVTGAAAAWVPLSWEEKLGETVIGSLAPEEERCTDPALQRRIEEVLEELTASAPSSPYTFRVYVADGDMVNAFAAPGGHLVVFRGLLQRLDGPEELAGVLAHEVQHVLQRHTTEALLRRLSLAALVGAMTGDSESVAAAAKVAVAVGGFAFSRADETEADREGMALLQAVGMDGAGMVRAYRVLERESEDLPNGLSYLSTHPRTEARIAMLEGMIAEAASDPSSAMAEQGGGRTAPVEAKISTASTGLGAADLNAEAQDGALRRQGSAEEWRTLVGDCH